MRINKTSVNALKVLEALQVLDISVAKGSAKPILGELETGKDFHGSDSLGESNLPIRKLQLDKRHAVDLLLNETAANSKHTTVVATGPLTIVTTTILRDSTSWQRSQNKMERMN